MRWLLLGLMTLVLASCREGSHAAREAEYVVIDYSRALRRENKLCLVSQVGPRMGPDDRLKEIKLHYRGFATMDRRDARRFAVEKVEDLLTRLNNNDICHPAGIRHPLTTKDVDITFEFNTFFGEFVNPHMVRFVRVNNGQISYYSFNCEYGKECTAAQESYEQAFELVQRLMEVETRLRNAPGEERGGVIRNNRQTVHMGNPPELKGHGY